jgi:glycogen operon protein
VRDFWRGEDQSLAEMGYRLAGSSDLYGGTGRSPFASINFVTAHDGFTLNDLVSYNEKHNEANGEDNQDGESHNRSWNCGVEGPTEDLDVLVTREKQKRNFLATLFLSQGVPMLLGGDEMGRSQGGNNNGYAQDNEVSWFHWEDERENWALLDFTEELSKLRRDHPVFRRRRFFQGRPIHGSDVSDIAWFKPDGEQMSEEDWAKGYARSIAIFLNGDAIPSPSPRGEPVKDDSFFLLLNGHDDVLSFRFPEGKWGDRWDVVLDTAAPLIEPGERMVKAGAELEVEGRTVTVLKRVY